MKPWPSQEEFARQGLALVLAHHIVYLAAEERTGKTLAAILIGEQHPAKEVLVVTKKKALEGWVDTLSKYKTNKPFRLTTYTQIDKEPVKQNQLVILDEAHNYISGAPKPSQTWSEVKQRCRQADIIYISATPYAQGVYLLYHQFAVSSFSPWARFTDYYKWHKVYGLEAHIFVKGMKVPVFTKADKELALADVEHLFITKTRAELGFEHEPEDVLHYIELDPITREVYNTLVKKKVVQLKAGTLACENVSKLRAALHMLEGGVAKIKDKYIVLANDEKIRHILANWGDKPNVAIMYYYIAEGTKLRQVFKHASILQADTHAEGVDLSMFEHLVIYSQNPSTAKHTQRRARQANKQRKTEIKVHFLLVKKAVSSQVYKAVAVNKRNYIDSLFEDNTV